MIFTIEIIDENLRLVRLVQDAFIQHGQLCGWLVAVYNSWVEVWISEMSKNQSEMRSFTHRTSIDDELAKGVPFVTVSLATYDTIHVRVSMYVDYIL